MTLTDRTDATEQEFRSRIAAFEGAPTPPEVVEAAVVEEVARAIAEAQNAHGSSYFPCLCGWEAGFGAGWEERGERHELLALAAAAVAAYRATQDGGAEEAVRRVEAVVDEWATTADECDRDADEYEARGATGPAALFRETADTCRAYADALRAALAPQAEQ